MLNRGFLVEIRRKAMRKGVWFRALDGLDRGILNLSAKLLDEVNSVTLRDQIMSILAKLENAFKSPFVRHLEAYGVKRLREVQAQAARLGYRFASELGGDGDFLRYLIFLDFNQPMGWGVYGKGRNK